jgi:hypothetical protein
MSLLRLQRQLAGFKLLVTDEPGFRPADAFLLRR